MSKLGWIVVVGLIGAAAQADTIYVDDDNCPGPGSGTKGDPYCSIQTAIDAAVDTGEIVVAPGTYFETIDLVGKAITLRSTDPTDPDVVANTIIDGTGFFHVVQCVSGEGSDTVLDGLTITGGVATGSFPDNVGGGMYNDASSPTVTNCTFSDNEAASGGGMFNDNSNPTVADCTFSGNSANGVFPDGLGGGICNQSSSPMVAGCTFNGNSAPRGGGIYNISSSPTVTDCSFSGNTAGSLGGGICDRVGSHPTVTDCSFDGNTAATLGGGIYNSSSSPTVTGCSFSGNASGSLGGGIHNTSGSSPRVTNCSFSENTANRGGGLYFFHGSPIVTNCTFNGNETVAGGGGVFISDEGYATVTNCTFAGNSAANGDALAIESFSPENPSTLEMANCIVWDGGDDIWNDGESTITIDYSDVKGGWSGTGSGNIDADPLFVGPGSGDYRLSAGSPCIDAGHNWAVAPDGADLDDDSDTSELTPLDLDANPRFAADEGDDTGCGVPVVVDMGAYEYQGSPFPVKLGDIDGNGAVGATDFLALLAAWGPCPEDCCLADFDLDGDVGATDFLILLANWG